MINMKFMYIMTPVLRQYTVVQLANLSVVCLGMSVVWASPMILKLADEEQAVLSRTITVSEGAWISSINMLIGLPGLISGGYFINAFGPKNSLIISFLPRIIMCLLNIFATDVWMILVARSLAGISDLIILSSVTIYSSEIAGKKIRGASGTLTQINAAVGMLISFGVGPFVSYLTMNILMTALVVAAFIPMLLLPESPYFLHAKGNTEKTVETLTFLHGTEELAHEEIKSYSISETDTNVSFLKLFEDRINIKTLGIVLAFGLGFQLVGYNVVIFYLQTVFEATHTSVSSEASSLIIGTVQLVACLGTFLLTDRFGRKPLICISLIVMAIGMLGLATFFTMMEGGNEIRGFLNYLPLISMAIIIYGHNSGMGSLLWIVVAELLHGPIRSYGMAITGFTTTGLSFLITLYFPAVTKSIGDSITYYTFATGCIATCLFVRFYVPETKGKTFVEIQTELGRRELMESSGMFSNGEHGPESPA